jgi:hypothetical protein
MKCHSVACKATADVRVYWPGHTIDMCAECAQRAHAVAGAMGLRLTLAMLLPAANFEAAFSAVWPKGRGEPN